MKRIIQKVHEAATTQAISILQAAIALSTHAQNVRKRKKCAVGAKKMNTRAETIVSGAKNMVYRPKKWLKSRGK